MGFEPVIGPKLIIKDGRKVIVRKKAEEKLKQYFKDGGVIPKSDNDNQKIDFSKFEQSFVPKFDPVEKPFHYNQGKIEVADFIADQKMNYFEGNVVKYLARYKYKNGLEDLRKCQWYLNKLIEINSGEK